MDTTPTRETYEDLQRAYDFLNVELFDGRLPPCMITLQRQHDTYGYFSANQFAKRGGKNDFAHEIALNPTYFAVRPVPETLSVMAREMVSLDQLLHSTGKKPRRRYRNTEWADMVEAIGLMPTDSGLPGGKRTGDSVQTYIIEGGLFDIASSKLLESDFKLPWADRCPPPPSAHELALQNSIASVSEPGPSGQAYSAPAAAAGAEGGVIAEEEGGEDRTILDFDEGDLPSPVSDTPKAPAAAIKPAPDLNIQVEDAPRMKVFAHATTEELAEMGIQPKEVQKNPSKTKFQCPVCKANSWGKPSLLLSCRGILKKQHPVADMLLVDGAVAAASTPAREDSDAEE